MLFAATGLGSAAFLAASTINAIVGTRLGGADYWAGIPTATFQVGAAIAAAVWGLSLDRLGRRPTLMLGTVIGAAGAMVAGLAVANHSLRAFLFGVLLMGMAQSAMQLGRFVAAEVHPAAERGRAIARVVMGATVGAVFGPLSVGVAGTLAARAGHDPLSGPYVVSAVLFVLGTVLLGLLLRPDPAALARRLEIAASAEPPAAPRALAEIFRDRLAVFAVVTMALGQVVMVMLMVITSVHMAHHDHALTSIAAVLSSHVFGMFAFSVVSGRMTDALGRIPVIAIGAAVLLAACATAPLSLRVFPLAASLMALGLGWNLCYVAGSALLADRITSGERGRAQGLNDSLIGAVSAAGSALSGVVFAAAGYAWMAVCGAVVSAALLGLALAMAPRPARFGRARGIAMAAVLAVGAVAWHTAFPPSRALVAGDFSAIAPAWSPDGAHLAVVLEDKVGLHLAVVDANTGERVVVADVPAGAPRAFSWSPDGKRLAYVGRDAEDGTPSGISVYDVASRESRALAEVAAPQWRADGSILAVCGPAVLSSFDGDEEDGHRHAPVYDMKQRFCRIDPDSGAVSRLALAAEPGMAVSPTADRVVFTRDGQLWTARLEDEDPDALPAAGEVSHAGWTPDGDRLVYAVPGPTGADVWTSRPDGEDRRPLLTGVRGLDPASARLTVNGYIFFAARVDGGTGSPPAGEDPADLFVAPFGGVALRLSNRHPSKRRFAVSPDGKRIAYEAARHDDKGRGGNGRTEIWIMKGPS